MRMGRITFELDDKLEKKLRKNISQDGYIKGRLSKALNDAVKCWLLQQRETV